MISRRSRRCSFFPPALVLAVLAGFTVTVTVTAPAPVGATGSVPVPAVEGPVTGGSRTGAPFWATPFDLAPSGYVEEEFFLSGTASDRGLSGPERTAPYKVRLLVRRPADPARFNGSAVLEWFNVSLQSEVEHDWPVAFPLLMRDGYASAAVSAQQASSTASTRRSAPLPPPCPTPPPPWCG
ncbi:MAG: alpha/beta hydrolase domain-containing protein [Acidimicrobiia bacterium]